MRFFFSMITKSFQLYILFDFSFWIFELFNKQRGKYGVWVTDAGARTRERRGSVVSVVSLSSPMVLRVGVPFPPPVSGVHRPGSGRLGRNGTVGRALDDDAVPHVGRYTVVVPRYDGAVPLLGVRPERVDAAVHGVAVRALVVPRVVRLEMVPLAAHALGAHQAHVQLRVRRVLSEYLVAVGLPMVLGVCSATTIFVLKSSNLYFYGHSNNNYRQ